MPIPLILGALVPVFVAIVHKLMPDSPVEAKHEWVQGACKEATQELNKHLPAWMIPNAPALESAVCEVVQAKLDQVLPK